MSSSPSVFYSLYLTQKEQMLKDLSAQAVCVWKLFFIKEASSGPSIAVSCNRGTGRKRKRNMTRLRFLLGEGVFGSVFYIEKLHRKPYAKKVFKDDALNISEAQSGKMDRSTPLYRPAPPRLGLPAEAYGPKLDVYMLIMSYLQQLGFPSDLFFEAADREAAIFTLNVYFENKFRTQLRSMTWPLPSDLLITLSDLFTSMMAFEPQDRFSPSLLDQLGQYLESLALSVREKTAWPLLPEDLQREIQFFRARQSSPLLIVSPFVSDEQAAELSSTSEEFSESPLPIQALAFSVLAASAAFAFNSTMLEGLL